MNKSPASGAYVSSQSRGGLLMGLNFFALSVWQSVEDPKVFLTHNKKVLGQNGSHTR